MSYKLLNSNRKYVTKINFTKLMCFGINKIVFLKNLQSPEIYIYQKGSRQEFWFDFCITTLQHILGDFERCQLP